MSMIGHAYALEYRHRQPVSGWALWDVYTDEDVAEENREEQVREHPHYEFRVREYTADE